MKKIVSMFALVAFSIGLTACNTIGGMGRDIERGGEKVQGAASDARR